MPEDVIIPPAPSTGVVETPPAAPHPEPPSPLKAAIQRGDHAEMNRLMNEQKRERSGHRPGRQEARQPTPSDADSAPATPVTEPDSGAGTQLKEPQASTKAEAGTKEYNFRELAADRDRWKSEAQDVGKRIQALEQRLAGQSPQVAERAAPLDIPFTEPRPDWNRILDASETIEEANEKYRQLMDQWIQKRDIARDREIQSRTQNALTQAQEQRRLVSIATTIRAKVEELAKVEGFEDLPQIYAESQSPYTDEMLRFYADDEHGARVMHHLILNPGQAQELTMLPTKLQKQRLVDIRDALVKSKPGISTKQTTDAPSPIRKAVTGRSEAPVEPLRAAREEGQKTGDWKKFNALMNERKRHRMGMA